jgi:serine/threonine protein kinase
VAWTDAEAYREVRERPTGTAGIPQRFEVLSQVGAGGVGVVYKVRDLETEEIVALKILKPEFASDPTGQENFKRELMLSRKITHKNVCRIYDFGRSNGVSYASMELVEGESLLTRLGRVGPMPVSQAIEIVKQICAGLREAHAQGIVHRDLKPANIMLDRSGSVKIMDFGVARLIQGDGPMTGTIVGTPAYMAPEQAELKPVSACTDIYALGLVFYEMVTGVPAFTGDSPVAVALKQIRDYPKRPREIVALLSPPIEAVIMKCIQKDSGKRFRSVEELEAALNKASKARPIAAWQLNIDRALRKAEQNVSDVLEDSVEITREYLKQRDWRGLVKDPKRVTAALVVPILLGGAITFALLRGGKSHKNYVQTAQVGSASQKSSSPGAEGQREIAPRINSQDLMVTNEVDLNRDTKSAALKTESPTEVSLKKNDQGSTPELLPAGHTQTTPTKKHEKAPAPADAQKTKSKQQIQARSQMPVNSTQAPVLTPVVATQPAAMDEVANAPQQKAATSEPIVAEASSASEKKAANADAKTPSTYFEVGSFKDESWADAAVEKLTQLGFHAVLMHKNLLWTQSYHVQVGPYDDPKEIEAARQTLASQGFKPHPVK